MVNRFSSNTICCSSDVIESCFSKCNQVAKGNKSVGISDLILCIAAMLGNNNFDEVQTGKAMDIVAVADLVAGIILCITCFFQSTVSNPVQIQPHLFPFANECYYLSRQMLFVVP